MPERFENKVVLVTGGGSGIGAATARRFAREGATVIVTGRRQEKLDDVAADGPVGRIVGRRLDVTDGAAVRSVIASVVEEFGRLDMVVNNAGVAPTGTVEMTSEEDWDAMMATTLTGAFHITRAALPHLKASHGNIVNVSSVCGLGGDWGAASYNAAKGGLTNFTRALALDHAAGGIRVNAVAPSFTKTEMTAEMNDDADLMARFMDRLPMGRPAEAEEVAAVIAFLASADASYVNGVIVPVDGGLGASNGQPRLG
jgi:meso-butanediol dehydrogenase/(S,S)-butanediol dehydrogenase/diacetyl reductase